VIAMAELQIVVSRYQNDPGPSNSKQLMGSTVEFNRPGLDSTTAGDRLVAESIAGLMQDSRERRNSAHGIVESHANSILDVAPVVRAVLCEREGFCHSVVVGCQRAQQRSDLACACVPSQNLAEPFPHLIR
jgi:hypothetical protein